MISAECSYGTLLGVERLVKYYGSQIRGMKPPTEKVTRIPDGHRADVGWRIVGDVSDR